MDCTNNSAILSWEESRGAQHYVGEVVSDQDSVFCNTEGTTCIVPDLSCGTVYSFSVLAMDMQCNSSFTESVLSGMGKFYRYKCLLNIYWCIIKMIY